MKLNPTIHTHPLAPHISSFQLLHDERTTPWTQVFISHTWRTSGRLVASEGGRFVGA